MPGERKSQENDWNAVSGKAVPGKNERAKPKDTENLQGMEIHSKNES